MQYPKTVQEAKQVAENMEIVHQGVERHESKTAKGKNQTLNKKQSKKGILGNSISCKGSAAVIRVQESRRGAERRGAVSLNSVVISVAMYIKIPFKILYFHVPLCSKAQFWEAATVNVLQRSGANLFDHYRIEIEQESGGVM